MEIKELDLSKWELFSDRHNSEVYNSEDGKWIVKLFAPGFGDTIEELEEEQRIAKVVYDMGVPTPAVGDLVKVGDKIGLIFERVPDKISFARKTKHEPESVDEIGRSFAKLCREFHEIECDTTQFRARKDILRELIEQDNMVDDEEREKVLAFLDTIPDGTKCIHGDLHTGNAILNNERSYIIDLGMFAYGDPILDVAIFYNFTNLIPDWLKQVVLYCDDELARKLWVAFAKEYFGISTDEEIAELDNKMRPIAALTMFIFNSKRPEPFIPEIVKNHLLPFL